MFKSLFGMGGMGMGGRGDSRCSAIEGENVRYDLHLNFEDAVFGIEDEIEIFRLDSCHTCDGSDKPGTKYSKCSTCNGQGKVVSPTRTLLGVFQQVMICSSCDGTGAISTPCTICSGEGRVKKSRRITIKVPPGIESGNLLRARAESNAGRKGGAPGDLLLGIKVKPHPVLRRKGTNILCTCKISYTEAILGTTKLIPSVDGMGELKIPAGIQPRTTTVLAKKGVYLF